MSDLPPAIAERAPSVAPVDSGGRVASIDVLRGFALLGILVMNIQSFSMPDAAYLNPTAYGDLSGANRWVWILGHLLTDEKMYGIFSMLFGAGIVLMTTRIERRGGRPGPIHYRRMGWLILFGLLHAHLLWSGDILYTYGMCGLAVYLFRKLAPRALVVWALLFFAVSSAIYAAFGTFVTSLPQDQFDEFVHENWLPTVAMIQDEIAAFRGSWLDQLPYRQSSAIEMETIVFVILFFWKSMGNMLLGMALFKWGVVTGERSRSFYLRMAAAGFLIGIPIVAFGIWQNFAAGWNARFSFFFGCQYNYWGAIVVDMGWIGAILALCTSPGFTVVKTALGAAGRMAFSNYILESVISTTIFYGYGFGLFGSFSRVQQILTVFAIWAVVLVLSPLWLRSFRFGPLEWLWRSLTYWRWMDIRYRHDRSG